MGQAPSDRTAIAWLHRRAGFGLGPGELDRLQRMGVDAVLDRLVDPARHGVPSVPDPWRAVDLAYTPGVNQGLRQQAMAAIGAWIDHLATTGRPTESWLTWFWHGHFATAIAKVRVAALMVEQLRLFQRAGAGPFTALLRAVTVDPAMLVWLDGRDNTRITPNENYGREVMELFSLGVGHYTEADVAANAAALSGWKIARTNPPSARFMPRLHDDTPRRLLGRSGVHDVDTVVATLVSQPACATFIAGSFAEALLGITDTGLTNDLAKRFRASNLDTRVLLRATLEAGLARLGGPASSQPTIVLAPVPWFAAARRATGSTVGPRILAKELAAAGQVPMNPPNVGGWPSGPAWLATSTVVARFNLASALAANAAPASPALTAAAGSDDAHLADVLGRPEGFSTATRAALGDARKAGGRPGVAPLALALASPDLTVA